MKTVLIDLHFLPSLEYFCVLLDAEEVVLEQHENFNKQSYRNRCHVLTTQGINRLTIPVTGKHGKTLITDVRIDDRIKWRQQGWRTLESAYANAPYFEHYADALKQELFSECSGLFDFNRRLLSMCLTWLKWDTRISESVSYEKNPGQGILDARNVISAKRGYTYRNYYSPQPYQQVFGSNFAANLSVIDLVFCEGPDATARIRASRKKN